MWFGFELTVAIKEKNIPEMYVSRFPSPKAQSIHIRIEGIHPLNYNYQRGFRDSVSIVYFDFLEQVNDLLNDISIFGNMTNFVGTININDPFHNKLPCPDELFDEVCMMQNGNMIQSKFVMLKLKENCICCFQSLATMPQQELM